MLLLFFLVTVAVAVAQAPNQAPPRYPMDLYLLADASGSISATNWQNIVNFADALQRNMASLALGYYESPQIDGLRVTILGFHCATFQDTLRYKPFLVGPTGNETRINEGLASMRKLKTDGQTCPSGGIAEITNEITAERARLGQTRPSAVVLLTDGVLTPSDTQRTTNSARRLLEQNETQMFLVNYGGGAEVMTQWNGILMSDKNIFESSNLDQISQVISALMLGNLQVRFAPSPEQQNELSNFTTPNNQTVCSKLRNNTARFYIEGKATTLFQLDQVACKIVIGGVQQLAAAPYRVGDGMYCDAPLPPGIVSTLLYSVSLYSQVEGGVQKDLFAPVNITVSTFRCLAVRTLTGEDGGCFPGAGAQQENTLLVYGPSVEELTDVNAYVCDFDGGSRVAARYSADLQGYQCLAPSLDISQALLAGTSPTPFKQFTLLNSQQQVLVQSSSESISVSSACVNLSQPTPMVQEVCWRGADVTSHAVVPELTGESVTTLLRDFQDLEFTCQVNGAAVQFPAEITAAGGVECKLLDMWEYLPSYSSQSNTKITIALQVRRIVQVEIGARGWWVLKSLEVALPRVSPCLEYSIANTCHGVNTKVTFTGEGTLNFLNSGFSCRIAGKTTPVANSQCDVQVVRGQTLQLVSGAAVYAMPQQQPAFPVCLNVADGFPTSHCFGQDSDELNAEAKLLEIYGESAAYVSQQSLECAFTFSSNTVLRTPTSWNGTALQCRIPSYKPQQVSLPYATTFSLDLYGTERIKTFAPQEFEYNVGACFSMRRPACLLRELQLRFQGEGNVSRCEFLGPNRVTVTQDCAAENWRPEEQGMEPRFTSVNVYGAGNVVLLQNASLLPPPPVCVQVEAPTEVALGQPMPAFVFTGSTLRDLLGDSQEEIRFDCQFLGERVPATLDGNAVACEFPQALIYEDLDSPEFSVGLQFGNSSRRRRLQQEQQQIEFYTTKLPSVKVDTGAALAPFAELTKQCYQSVFSDYEGQVECEILVGGTEWQSCKKPYVGPEVLTLPYRLVTVRKDTGQMLVLEQGQVEVCGKQALRTNSPTVQVVVDDGSEASSGELSGGAIAGIVIGVLAFLLLLLLLLFCCCFRRKRKEEGSQESREKREAAELAKERDEELLQPEDKYSTPTPPPPVEPPQVIVKSSTNNEEVVYVDMRTATTNDEPLVEMPVHVEEEEVEIEDRPAPPIPPAPVAVMPPAQQTFDFRSGDLVERFNPETMQWTEVGVVAAQVDANYVTLAAAGGASEVVERKYLRALDTDFHIGEQVEELGRDGEWRPAQIIMQKSATQYVVDGPGGTNMVRTKPQSLRFPQYRGGDLLEYRALETNKNTAWRKFTVVGLEPNGIVVGLEDGQVDPKRIANRLVRRRIKQADTLPATAAKRGQAALNSNNVDFEELPDFCFQITVDKSKGLGVRLGWTRNSEVVVQSFLTIAGVGAGPLEESERVNLGDQLLAINGTSIGGKSFAEVSDMIRQSDGRIKLKFGRWADTLRKRGVQPGADQHQLQVV